MPAYMIVTAAIADREAFLRSGYAGAAAELTERFGGQYLLRASGAELLEGGFGNGASVVLSRWPDKEAAKRFWNSPEYAAVKKLRDKLGDCQVLLIEAPDVSG